MSLERPPGRDGATAAPSDPVLRPPAAAEFLGLSVSCLAKLRLRGGGPSYVRMSPTAVGYRMSALNAFLDSRTFSSTAQYATVA